MLSPTALGIADEAIVIGDEKSCKIVQIHYKIFSPVFPPSSENNPKDLFLGKKEFYSKEGQL